MDAAKDKLRQAFADASLEEREKLLEAIKSFSKLPDMTDELPNLLQKIQQQALKKAMQYRQYAFYAAVLVLVAIFAFFGYKLYLSLTEKERKREEKLKAKQEKSKKKK